MQRLSAHDVPCAPVMTRREMYDHPQVRANGIVIETDHPQAGPIRQTRTPARFSATPTDPPRPARRLGEDTETVLAEIGYDAETITAMIRDGIATGTQESAE